MVIQAPGASKIAERSDGVKDSFLDLLSKSV
jgi:hypothetical protein